MEDASTPVLKPKIPIFRLTCFCNSSQYPARYSTSKSKHRRRILSPFLQRRLGSARPISEIINNSSYSLFGPPFHNGCPDLLELQRYQGGGMQQWELQSRLRHGSEEEVLDLSRLGDDPLHNLRRKGNATILKQGYRTRPALKISAVLCWLARESVAVLSLPREWEN